MCAMRLFGRCALCPQRPCRRRAAEQRDELASDHSITSSARARSDAGTSRPIAFAVFEIDRELELDDLHDRQVSRLGSFENSADIDADLAIGVGKARSIAHQAAGLGEISPFVDCRH